MTDRHPRSGPIGVPSILQVLAIICPETLIHGHWSGSRCYWRWKSRSLGGRPQIETGLRASLIQHLVLETGLQPYDYMALVLVVEGAGGCITDWKGRPLSINTPGQVLAFASRRLHAAALAELNR